jgi:hypothetical protein
MVGNLKGGVVCLSLDLSRDPDYMSIVSERKFVTCYSVTIRDIRTVLLSGILSSWCYGKGEHCYPQRDMFHNTKSGKLKCQQL